VLPHDTLRLSLRLRGGIDRNNRAGSKPGAGPISSTSEAADRRDRLRRLAMETVDLSKDPYFMMNHLGTFECKLCLTLHNTEGNYLAHTQGKRHQTNLAKRAARDAAHRGENKYSRVGPTSAKVSVRRKVIRIGRPGYKVVKQRDPTTEQRSLLFEISFPEIEEGMQPRHRFMSAFEQRVEAPDKKYQFLLFAADPYETVAFKIPNLQIDKEPGKFVTKWDSVARKFTLQLHFRDSAKATISVNEVARDGAEPRAKRVR
jgi:splicing factor 3A subunit 2